MYVLKQLLSHCVVSVIISPSGTLVWAKFTTSLRTWPTDWIVILRAVRRDIVISGFGYSSGYASKGYLVLANSESHSVEKICIPYIYLAY